MPIPVILAALGGALAATAATTALVSRSPNSFFTRDEDDDDDVDFDDDDDLDDDYDEDEEMRESELFEQATAAWEETEDMFDDEDGPPRKRKKGKSKRGRSTPTSPDSSEPFTEATVFAVADRFGFSEAVVKVGLAQMDIELADVVKLATALNFTEESAVTLVYHGGHIAKSLAAQLGVSMAEIPNAMKAFAQEMQEAQEAQAAQAASTDTEAPTEEASHEESASVEYGD
jgi:hypothetical protein